MPAITRSIAPSKSSIRIVVRSWRPAKIAASLQRLARSAPVRPEVWRAIWDSSTSSASGLPRVCTPQDRLAAVQVGRRDEHLAVEAAGTEQRGVEVLEPVRGAHHDHLRRLVEAVELDEQLVQRLVVLAVEAAARAGRADGVELVDEDDRRRVLARLFEELADAGGAEAGEHLHERRGALRVELRAGLLRDRLREQRLAGAGRAVEQDPLRHAGAEALEALRVAEEVDDLLQLGLRLLDAGDVVPARRRSSRSPPASPASRAACTAACARAGR